MALATWWWLDALPFLSPLDEFQVLAHPGDNLLTRLSGLDAAEIQQRRQGGHQPYAAFWRGQPVAYGWVARRRAVIGELGLNLWLRPGHRYLWDFATLPAYRGRGIYPHLLQEILQRERAEAEFFWIIYAPENGPSKQGIRRAGFKTVGHLSLLADGRTALAAAVRSRRSQAGAEFLGVPLVDGDLFPCWHCAGATYPPSPGSAGCTCRPTAPGRQQACPCLPDDSHPPHRAVAARQGLD